MMSITVLAWFILCLTEDGMCLAYPYKNIVFDTSSFSRIKNPLHPNNFKDFFKLM